MSRYLRRPAFVISLCILTVGALAQFTSADLIRKRARRLCGIPNYGSYQANEPRQRATLASFLVPDSVAVGDGELKRKVFQPLDASLVVGDCYLTNIRLIVDSNGNYRLGYRAANSAPSLDRVTPPLPGAIRAEPSSKAANTPIMPVRHHRFQVTVRLYTGPDNPENPDHKRAGGIELATVSLAPFYVPPQGEIADSKVGHFDQFIVGFGDAMQAEFELEIDPSLTLPTNTAYPLSQQIRR